MASLTTLCLTLHRQPIGMCKELCIYGNDYNTPDSTSVRDNIQMVDLAKGHVCALKTILEQNGLAIYNLTIDHGYLVLDVVIVFDKVNGMKEPYVIKDRRPEDIATCYCNPAKAKAELGWEHSLELRQCVVIVGTSRRTILMDTKLNDNK